jgi:carbon storage regulator
MLYLTRKVGEAVIINHEIEVRVVETRGKSVKLGFVFPSGASVLREEVFLEVEAVNRAAAAGDLDAVLNQSGSEREEDR